jgi:hypothetical protein
METAGICAFNRLVMLLKIKEIISALSSLIMVINLNEFSIIISFGLHGSWDIFQSYMHVPIYPRLVVQTEAEELIHLADRCVNKSSFHLLDHGVKNNCAPSFYLDILPGYWDLFHWYVCQYIQGWWSSTMIYKFWTSWCAMISWRALKTIFQRDSNSHPNNLVRLKRSISWHAQNNVWAKSCHWVCRYIWFSTILFICLYIC